MSVKLRREADSRIDDLTQRAVRVETKVENLSGQMATHEQNNRSRFTEVFSHIGALREQGVRLETTDEHHTIKLDKIIGKLDVLVADKTAKEAIANDRVETIKNIPNLMKWSAGVMLGVVGLGSAWAAVKAYFH